MKNTWLFFTAAGIWLIFGLWISSNSSAAPIGPPEPPARYFGPISPGSGFNPHIGMVVLARINGVLCGEGTTSQDASEIVYLIDVRSISDQDPNCGVPGAAIIFTIDGQEMRPTATWDNSASTFLPLSPFFPTATPNITATAAAQNTATAAVQQTATAAAQKTATAAAQQTATASAVPPTPTSSFIYLPILNK